MSKQVGSNTFTDGMVLDMNPLTTPNNVLTDCLNGSIITFNGNEFVLQNDMGNAIVETASLKKGYVPIGIKEYNGIIYVVSYNPLEDRVEFGSFPSPERNFSGEDFKPEDFDLLGINLKRNSFYSTQTGGVMNDDGTLVNNPPTTIGIEDYWKMPVDTTVDQKYVFSKTTIEDAFDIYPLKLNSGDRFVIYYIDNISDPNNDYVANILKPFVSIKDGEKRLFKVEVLNQNNEVIDCDPLFYDSGDVQGENIFNGNSDLNYSIYKGTDGVLKIKISLEIPQNFDLKILQIFSTDGTYKARLKMYGYSASVMQVKGCQLNVRYGTGTVYDQYILFDQDTLYRPIGDDFEMLPDLKLTAIFNEGLQLGEYTFTLRPYTQYGYIDSLTRTGSFTISDDFLLNTPIADFDYIRWEKTNPTTFTLLFETTLEIPEDYNFTVEDTHIEMYDMWSDCSHVFQTGSTALTYTHPSTPYNFNTFPKGVTSDDTQRYGVPLNRLETNDKLILPTTNVNNLFQVGYDDLREDHFYVLLVSYYVRNTDDGAYSWYRAYRYFYTNDAFNTLFSTVSDFSYGAYPEHDISLTVTPTAQEEINPIFTSWYLLDSLLYDPLQQIHNSGVIRTGAAIYPSDFYNDIQLLIKPVEKQRRKTEVQSLVFSCAYVYVGLLGVLNNDVITINALASKTVNPQNNRLVNIPNIYESTILVPYNTLTTFNKTVSFNDTLVVLKYSSTIITNSKKLLLYETLPIEIVHEIYPEYYNASKNVQETLFLTSNNTLNQSSLVTNYYTNGQETNSRVRLTLAYTFDTNSELDSQDFWNYDTTGIWQNISLGEPTLEDLFLSVTKRFDTTTPLSIIQNTLIKNDPSNNLNGQHVLLHNSFNQMALIEGLSFSELGALVEYLTGVGAYFATRTILPSYLEVKALTSGTTYYESDNSSLDFEVNILGLSLTFRNDYCFKIINGPSNTSSWIILKPASILPYVQGKVSLATTYDWDLFPKAKPQVQNLTGSQVIQVYPGLGMSTLTLTDLNVSLNDHPLLTTTLNNRYHIEDGLSVNINYHAENFPLRDMIDKGALKIINQYPLLDLSSLDGMSLPWLTKIAIPYHEEPNTPLILILQLT